ncbi:glycosyltransferase family 2 protein [Haloferax volcanii]|uniref:Putative glycosyltransferase n=1 Tax=Haloferax volcanii JCM 10717 TaxID=1227458 RepID=M0HTH4_HALVO|nr:glycosyltransferase family 2 protein [Haloferax alexandrinus]ELZ87910.1 putative glycosyltransferase [Haloferax alexandrinus JCM 10717]
MGSQPKVTAVILNWNDSERTLFCVESVRDCQYSNLDLIVVDNGSTDNSKQQLESQLRQENLIINEENLGFAGGMNCGISEALADGTDYIWILNNDIVIEDSGIVQQLVDVFESNDEVGIVSPLVRKHPMTEQVWFSRGEVNFSNGDVGHSNIDISSINRELLQSEYVPFCSPLIRSEIFDEIGLISEDYFLYYEDADYCQMVVNEGYRIVTAVNSVIFHEVNVSSGGMFSPLFSYYRARNRWLFSKKHGNENFNVLLYLWWVFKAISHRILYQEFASAKAILQGTLHGLAGKSGKGPYPKS